MVKDYKKTLICFCSESLPISKLILEIFFSLSEIFEKIVGLSENLTKRQQMISVVLKIKDY